MTTPYRSEADALRERQRSLEHESVRLKEQTSELEGLRAREGEIERELASIRAKLGASAAKHALPLLDSVRVASPCSASWDEMFGDDHVRFCVSCEKNVYNLSAMPREDAERLLRERVGKELCVRFHRRVDGTILTEDCPVGVKRKRRKKLALAVAGAMTAAATSMLARGVSHTQGEIVTQGAMPVTTVIDVRGEPERSVPPSKVEPLPHVMGKVAAPEPEMEPSLSHPYELNRRPPTEVRRARR